MDVSKDEKQAEAGSPFAPDRNWGSGRGGYYVELSPDIPDVPPYSFLMEGGVRPGETTELAGLRVTREGGLDPSDVDHQNFLFTAVGAMVVIGGHIELEMKRLLYTYGRSGKSLGQLPDEWKALEHKLRSLNSTAPEVAELKRVIGWATEQRIRERRNDLVHSTWTLFNTGHFDGARFGRGRPGANMISRGQDFVDEIGKMTEYLNKLQSLCPWATAILPPLPADVPRPQPITVTLEPVGLDRGY